MQNFLSHKEASEARMEENLDHDFAKRIKTARLVQAFSVQDAAKAIGVSVPTYRRYEAGHTKHLRVNKIVKIAIDLRCSPAYLIGFTEDM